MIKVIIIFFLVINVVSCNVTSKNLTISENKYGKRISSNSAIFLTASYYISKGDVYTASEILNKKIKNLKLLQLKFFSNLVSGNFEVANKVSILKKNSRNVWLKSFRNVPYNIGLHADCTDTTKFDPKNKIPSIDGTFCTDGTKVIKKK